jgi:hypothetical protein
VRESVPKVIGGNRLVSQTLDLTRGAAVLAFHDHIYSNERLYFGVACDLLGTDYGSAKATSSAGSFAAPTASTMYCRPLIM